VSSVPPGLSRTQPIVARDAWMVTISVLEALTGKTGPADVEPAPRVAPQRSRRRRVRSAGDDVPVHYLPHATATFVERVSDRSILVNWCDSTSGHYCDQLWTRKSASRAGYCALTGDLIAPDDVVYVPYARAGRPPANEQAMILASSLELVSN